MATVKLFLRDREVTVEASIERHVEDCFFESGYWSEGLSAHGDGDGTSIIGGPLTDDELNELADDYDFYDLWHEARIDAAEAWADMER